MFTVRTLKRFERDFKRLYKKYPSLKADLLAFLEAIHKSQDFGVSLGRNMYKCRLNIAAMSRGKSGVGRVILMLRMQEGIILLCTLYVKSEMGNLSDAALRQLVEEAHQELADATAAG